MKKEYEFQDHNQPIVIKITQKSEGKLLRPTVLRPVIYKDAGSPVGSDVDQPLPFKTPENVIYRTSVEETQIPLGRETPIPLDKPDSTLSAAGTSLRKESPSSLRRETPIPLEEETLLPLEKSDSTLSAAETSSLGKETPIPLRRETPIPLEEETPISLGKETPNRLRKKTPIALRKRTPIPLDQSDSTLSAAETSSNDNKRKCAIEVIVRETHDENCKKHKDKAENKTSESEHVIGRMTVQTCANSGSATGSLKNSAKGFRLNDPVNFNKPILEYRRRIDKTPILPMSLPSKEPTLVMRTDTFDLENNNPLRYERNCTIVETPSKKIITIDKLPLDNYQYHDK